MLRFLKRIAAHTTLVVVCAVLLFATPASAHDTTDGSIVLEINDQRIVGTAVVRFDDLGYVDTSGDGLLDSDELAAQEADVAPTLVDTVREKVAISVDGEDVLIIGAGVPSVGIAGADDGEPEPSEIVTLAFATGPHDGDVAEVALDWAFDSPVRWVVLADEDRAVTGELGDDGTASFSFGAWVSISSFFALGIEHIQFGPDHLLFLLVLTLGVVGSAVTKVSTRQAVKLVTAFTAGHAVSLCLAFFDVVSVPAGVVEPLISLSIVAGAVVAIRGVDTHHRAWVVALIGLVHGLGFASSLGSMGVATSQRVPAVAAFNVGIDVAQTAVVLSIIAALWIVQAVLKEKTSWVRIPAAGLAGAMGLVWTIGRIAETLG